MSKKNNARAQKPLSSKPAARQADPAYPVAPEDLDEQQRRLRTAAAAGASALKAPEPSFSAPATLLSKPLAPLAAVWPDPLPARGKPNLAQEAAATKPPAASTASKPSPAPAPQAPQPPAQSKPPTSLEKSPVLAQPPKPATAKKINVNFALLKPDAKGVSLCGDFNGWSPSSTPLKRLNDGHWAATVALAPGSYQYKFLIDGEWFADPAAQKNVPNQYGSLNSVVEVRP